MKNIFIILLVSVFFLSPVSALAQSSSGSTKGCLCMGDISVNNLATNFIDSSMDGQIKNICESLGGSYKSVSCSGASIAVSVTETQCNKSTLQNSLMQQFGIPDTALLFINNDIVCFWSDIPSNVPMVNLDGSIVGGTGGGGSFNFGTYKKTVKLDNPLESGTTDIKEILGNVIKTVTGLMGGVVLLMIVWGGFTWLRSMGNPEKVKKGANMIMWAVLGAIIILSSYFLLTNTLRLLASG